VLAAIDRALDSPPATISISVNGPRAIPEVGVGGFTDPTTGDVSIWLDPNSRLGVPTMLRTWLPLTLAHELSHSARILAGPGYGRMLGEAIVTEGLADEFSKTVVANAPRVPWTDGLTPAQEKQAWADAQALLSTADFSLHATWFFGAGAIPRWAGYTLGSHIVAAYRTKHPELTWHGLTRRTAAEILTGSGYRP
jgi:uncharacterized protein YjaZ